MPDIDDPDELHALASIAMDHALSSLQPRGPLLPFAIVEDESGRKLIRAVGDRLEDMVKNTRFLITESPSPMRAAMVCDGYSTHTGSRMDTVFVEAFEGGAAGGIVVAQSYRSVGFVKKRIELVGRPGVVERGCPPLF